MISKREATNGPQAIPNLGLDSSLRSMGQSTWVAADSAIRTEPTRYRRCQESSSSSSSAPPVAATSSSVSLRLARGPPPTRDGMPVFHDHLNLSIESQIGSTSGCLEIAHSAVAPAWQWWRSSVPMHVCLRPRAGCIRISVPTPAHKLCVITKSDTDIVYRWEFGFEHVFV